MPDLERRLVELAPYLETPAAPDVAPVVLRRLQEAPAPHRRPWRLRVAIALVALLAVAGALAASPDARSAVLRLLRLRGATVERVATNPAPAPTPSTQAAARAPATVADALPQLGDATDLTAARRRSGLSVDPPALLGPPDLVRVATHASVSSVVSLLYGVRDDLPATRVDGVGALVMVFRGGVENRFVEKMAGPDTRVERVTVSGGRGLWLEGEPHFLLARGPGGAIVEEQARLAGNTLLWERDGLLWRLEADVPYARALAIAESVP